MKRVIVFSFVVIFSLVLFSCIPPKEEVNFVYNYDERKTYVYDLELSGNGIITYLFLSYSGDFDLKTSFVLSCRKEGNQKLFTIIFDKFNLNSSFGFSDVISQFINLTNFEISFYMDEKGNKSLKSYDPFSLLILDLVLPKLPEVDPTNELVFRTFDYKVGDTGIRNEISNVVNVHGSSKNFSIDSFTSFYALDLRDADIVVGNLGFLGSGKVVDFVLNDYTVRLDSKSTVPLFTGSLTKIIGFKGSAILRLRLKKVI